MARWLLLSENQHHTPRQSCSQGENYSRWAATLSSNEWLNLPVSINNTPSYSLLGFPHHHKILTHDYSFVEFLNELVDTRKCIYSPTVHFNIFSCELFVDFIQGQFDENKSAIEFAKDE